MGNRKTISHERQRLIHIYLHSGIPLMIFGYPSRVSRMMLEMYGVDGLKAVRIL